MIVSSRNCKEERKVSRTYWSRGRFGPTAPLRTRRSQKCSQLIPARETDEHRAIRPMKDRNTAVPCLDPGPLPLGQGTGHDWHLVSLRR